MRQRMRAVSHAHFRRSSVVASSSLLFVMQVVHQSSLKAFRACVPPLTYTTHKGSAGRVGIIGGSLEYTGAPYFAAISSLKAGGDLAHVFCPDAAAPVIKAYSPELIVHPLLSADATETTKSVLPWLPRMHSLVIGPGLGRDPAIMASVKALIAEARKMSKVMVIDADGLYLVTLDPSIVEGYRDAILTPNEAEFRRLYTKVFGVEGVGDGDRGEQTKLLAAKLGNLVIVRKGHVDLITNGEKVIECDERGSPRRCGGQGDLLSGTIGLFSHWTKTTPPTQVPGLVAAYGACFLVKKCAELAFARHGRSMLASDMIDEIQTVFRTILEQRDDCG